MNVAYLHHDVPKLLAQRKGWVIFVGVLVFNNVLLSVALLYKSERTVLMPPEIRRAFSIGQGEISIPYLEDMGWGLSKLLLDLSPASFSYNHEKLLKYAAPEAHGNLRQQLLKEGKHYTKLQLSTHFYPTQLIANPKTLEVKVIGTLTSFVAGKQVSSSQETIDFKFIERAGGLYIKSVSGGIKDDL